MGDKELANCIKDIVSTYGAIITQAIANFIIAFENSKENGQDLPLAIDLYNDLCRKLGILDNNGKS